MKTTKIIGYINAMIRLIDKDTDEFARYIATRTKLQRRTHRIKSDYAHALLIKTAKEAQDE